MGGAPRGSVPPVVYRKRVPNVTPHTLDKVPPMLSPRQTRCTGSYGAQGILGTLRSSSGARGALRGSPWAHFGRKPLWRKGLRASAIFRWRGDSCTLQVLFLGLCVGVGGRWRYKPSTYAIHAPPPIATSPPNSIVRIHHIATPCQVIA
jgi:hypothetical protein